eukprot:g1017.t1
MNLSLRYHGLLPFFFLAALALTTIGVSSLDTDSPAASAPLDLADDFFEGLDVSIDDLIPVSEQSVVEEQARGLYRDVLPAGGLMKMAWATPVLRLNVSSFFPNVNSKKLNARLSEIIETVFDKFKAAHREKLCGDKKDELCDISDAFTKWQASGGYRKHLSKFKEFRVMEQMISIASHRFLKAAGVGSYGKAHGAGVSRLASKRSGGAVGASSPKLLESAGSSMVPEDAPAPPPESIRLWATVHQMCQAHKTHDAPGAMISGAYYVKVPPGAGHVILYDARRWASEDITIYPREGEMLIFPSWVSRQVMPTPGKNRRLALSFNTPGEWEGTADVGTSYALPRMTTVTDFSQMYEKGQKGTSKGQKQLA